MFDTSTEIGRAAKGRLESESVAWISTVREDGMPQPVPVWFLWDGDSFLVYTTPDSQKIKNIRGNPNVAINLNSDPHGEEVVRAEGSATIEKDAYPATEIPAYLEKYRSGIESIGMTPESFDETYNLAIRVRPFRWMVW